MYAEIRRDGAFSDARFWFLCHVVSLLLRKWVRIQGTVLILDPNGFEHGNLYKKTLNSLAPSYIIDPVALCPFASPWVFCRTGLLNIPKVPRNRIGEAAFIHYAPQLCNTLPTSITEVGSVDICYKKYSLFFLYSFQSIYSNFLFFTGLFVLFVPSISSFKY